MGTHPVFCGHPGGGSPAGQRHEKRDAASVRSLVAQHLDVNTQQADGSTALEWAAHWDDLQTADLLLRAKASADILNDYGASPLWEACNNGSAAMVEKLAQAGANLNATLLATGETALMRCARTGNVDAVKSLVLHGANVNAGEKQKGQTALMWALEERHPDVVKLLIASEADVRVHSGSGFTPLLFAARQGDLASTQLLLEKGVDINEATPGGLNPLLVAIDCNHESLAIFLVEKGANPNTADPDGVTPLHYALRKGMSPLRAALSESPAYDYLFRPNMPKLVAALLEHGADPNARISVDLPRYGVNSLPQLGLAGATPFLLAAATGDVGVMRELLAKGADRNLATNDNATPLMVAAGVGRRERRSREEEKQAAEAVRFLIELGAEVNAATKAVSPSSLAHQVSHNEGLTALHGAAFTGADEIIQFLVERGANLDAMDRFGETPLSIATGDPNGLIADYGEQLHVYKSTSDLVRKLHRERLQQTSGADSPNENR